MAGFLDFLLGNMLKGGAPASATNPQILQDVLKKVEWSQPGGEQSISSGSQINPLQDLMKNMMGGQQPSMQGGMGMPGAGAGGMAGGAGADPSALGVKADVSNPMGNESLRKMMLMQYLQKQQQGAPGMQSAGGAGMGGGMPMARMGGGMGGGQMAAPPAGGLTSMPYPAAQRPRFIGSR